MVECQSISKVPGVKSPQSNPGLKFFVVVFRGLQKPQVALTCDFSHLSVTATTCHNWKLILKPGEVNNQTVKYNVFVYLKLGINKSK